MKQQIQTNKTIMDLQNFQFSLVLPQLILYILHQKYCSGHVHTQKVLKIQLTASLAMFIRLEYYYTRCFMGYVLFFKLQ